MRPIRCRLPMGGSSAPFAPYLVYVPDDFALSLCFSGGGDYANGRFMFDADGNLWSGQNWLPGSQSGVVWVANNWNSLQGAAGEEPPRPVSTWGGGSGFHCNLWCGPPGGATATGQSAPILKLRLLSPPGLRKGMQEVLPI